MPGFGVPGTAVPGTAVPVPDVPKIGAPAGGDKGDKNGKSKGNKDGEVLVVPTQAELIVKVPVGTKLYFDDHPVSITREGRFQTPQLTQGQTYYYILRAEGVRDGKPVSETRKVVLRPGEVIRANFADLEHPVVTTVRAP